MKLCLLFAACTALCTLSLTQAYAEEETMESEKREFKIFQFPRDRIPVIDGKTCDWDIVPDEYRYGQEHLKEIVNNLPNDPEVLDVTVTVGWVKGLNRLYFLYEAYDNFWDFERVDPRAIRRGSYGYMNDIFEIVVDGNRSGGDLIDNPLIENPYERFVRYSGTHAQNYHIFTPPVHGEWCAVWGGQPWIKDFPFANYAYSYDFKQGESGKLVLEFYITPFDYASNKGYQYSVESQLKENRIIGLTWMVLDYNGGRRRDGFYSLAHSGRPWSDASACLPFRLMPLEEKFREKIEADWSFKIVDRERRMVAFRDESYGNITEWKWYFGDGNTSGEQNPVHVYEHPGFNYIVTLEVSGPDGNATRARFWDVVLE